MPMRALETALHEGRFESEGWRVRKDGSRFWAHVVIDPIRNAMGDLLGYAQVTRDITERQSASVALEKAKEALFQSQKLEAIGKLTGGVAHDFNNLLSVITNAMAVLRMRLDKPDDLRLLDAIERAANRGATLTQQLLTFARQQPLKQDVHDINEVIGSFESVLRRAVRGSLDFDIELATDLPKVMVDAPQVEAAMLNLIVNARDATPDGGRIVLRTARAQLAGGQVGTLAAGAYVKLEVCDTGEGMAADVIGRAIEPFFTTKPVGKGTGLGLSHVYGLVQQSGGDLVIDSAPGKGATVALYFPALAEGVQGQATADTRDKALVVDDQEDVLLMAIELFQTLG
jgi:signal transduction histidine kinase